ncbi:MAG: hypothetical protein HLX50_01455 [Alteromonadaceae bacterium]|nr:hypothetical protein [Alteromonadaceae bacterium]
MFETPGEEIYVVPGDVTEVTVEVWGAGGAGGAVTDRGASGGGGGGAYARTRLSVSPGDQLIVQVGAGGTSQSSAGDSWVAQSSQVVARAEGGTSVAANDSGGARGGRAAQSIGNEARYSGGRGADGLVRGWFGRLQGGGGGSSAGTGASGENGDEDTGGAAPDGGGDGGDGSDTAGLGSSGGSPGGRPGGGGGGATTRALLGGDFPGGTGADGQVRISRASSGGDVGVGCKASFPDGISSYNGGQIHFGQNAQLIGSPDSRLEAGIISKNDGSSLGTCGNNDCTATNSPVAALNLPEFPAINAPSDTSVYLGYREARTIGDSGNNRFSSIETGFQAELSFSANYDTYYIGTLNLGSSSTVFLQPGDYYIENIVSIGFQADIQVLGSGTARLFVSGDVQLGSSSFFNSPGTDQSGNVSKLLLASYGDISLKNNATLSGALFAMGDINLGSASYVYGGATAADITLGTNSKLYFESQGMADLDFGGVCDGEQGEQVDHFLILHGGTGVTCQPTPITFQAMDAGGSIVTDYDGQVSLSTSTGAGFWQAGNGVEGDLTAVSDNTGEAFYQFSPADGGQVTLGFQHAIPDRSVTSFTVNLDITDSNVRESASSDPDLEITTAGFVFHQGVDFQNSIPSQISGKPSEGLNLTAIRANDEGACEAFLVDTQTVNVGVVCDAPGNCSDSGMMQVNEQTVGNNDKGEDIKPTEANVEELEFDFGDDTTSSAPLTLEYNDAGRVKLFASMPLMDDEGNPTGETIFGSSNPFVVVPAGLCIQPKDPEGICTLDDVERYSDCDVFATAGEEFELQITAVGWESDGDLDYCEGNVATPNFELEGIELSSKVVGLDHKDAVDGDVFRILDDGEEKRDYEHTISTNGMVQLDDIRQSEIGVFKFKADPSDIKYFGLDGPSGKSKPIGRFKPKYFDISIDDGVFSSKPLAPQARTMCTEEGDRNWVYTGEPFGWKSAAQIIITPQNSRGEPVKNYSGTSFQLLDPIDIRSALGDFPVKEKKEKDAEGDPLELDGSLVEVDEFEKGSDGELIYVFDAGDKFKYLKSVDARVDAYTPNPVFTLKQFEDADGVTAKKPSDFFDKTFEPSADNGFEIRYGRIRLENAYGPENTALPIPLTAEVYGENGFERHEDDNCWFYDLSENTELNFGDSDLDDSHTQVFEVSDVGLTLENGVAQTSPDDYRLRLTAPGVPENPDEKGVYVKLNVGNDWLKDFWDPDEPSTLKDPSAWATFGVYRGNDRIIYWREVQN